MNRFTDKPEESSEKKKPREAYVRKLLRFIKTHHEVLRKIQQDNRESKWNEKQSSKNAIDILSSLEKVVNDVDKDVMNIGQRTGLNPGYLRHKINNVSSLSDKSRSKSLPKEITRLPHPIIKLSGNKRSSQLFKTILTDDSNNIHVTVLLQQGNKTLIVSSEYVLQHTIVSESDVYQFKTCTQKNDSKFTAVVYDARVEHFMFLKAQKPSLANISEHKLFGKEKSKNGMAKQLDGKPCQEDDAPNSQKVSAIHYYDICGFSHSLPLTTVLDDSSELHLGMGQEKIKSSMMKIQLQLDKSCQEDDATPSLQKVSVMPISLKAPMHYDIRGSFSSLPPTAVLDDSVFLERLLLGMGQEKIRNSMMMKILQLKLDDKSCQEDVAMPNSKKVSAMLTLLEPLIHHDIRGSSHSLPPMSTAVVEDRLLELYLQVGMNHMTASLSSLQQQLPSFSYCLEDNSFLSAESILFSHSKHDDRIDYTFISVSTMKTSYRKGNLINFNYISLRYHHALVPKSQTGFYGISMLEYSRITYQNDVHATPHAIAGYKYCMTTTSTVPPHDDNIHSASPAAVKDDKSGCNGDCTNVLHSGTEREDIDSSQSTDSEIPFTKQQEPSDVESDTAYDECDQQPTVSECLVWSKRAFDFRLANRISESAECYKKALSSVDEATPTEDLISCYSSYGNLLHNNGDYTTAIVQYQQAIAQCKSPTKLAEDCKSKAAVVLWGEDTMLAEDHCDYQSMCWIHGNLGNSYINVGKKAQGIQHLEKALELTRVHDPSPSSLSRALNNLGAGYQAVGDIDRSEELYDEALTQSLYGGDHNGQARAYGNLGNLYSLKKDYERAIPHFSEVLEISNDPSIACIAHHNRGCGYYELAEEKKKGIRGNREYLVCDYHGHHSTTSVQPFQLPKNITILYRQGLADLEEVISIHESRFASITASLNNVDLYVCLFETNSKTFARAQDCAYCLGDHHRALLLAEQCRSRTLAELMLRRNTHSLNLELCSPVTLDQVHNIMRLQEPDVPVVMLSWTGNRLLGWILIYNGNEVTMDTFEHEPPEELFDDKSFDVYLQYYMGQVLSGELESLTSSGTALTTNDEKYQIAEMEEENSENYKEMDKLRMSSLMKLSKLIAEPIQNTIDSAGIAKYHSTQRNEIIVITDSTTKLIPFASLETKPSQLFGDQYTIRFMPSILTLGLLSQTPSVVIEMPPVDDTNMCIVGDPLTPPFIVDDREWDLGPLPHAREEAEWVGHYMKTKPLTGREPTKTAVLHQMKDARLIHLATHGSASKGFLVLAGNSILKSSCPTIKVVEDAKHVLLYAGDVESLSLCAGLVVLSSCDSSRGAIKGDDIQGMARAFLVAGAQSVMTSLWKVPDKSARFFIQFFYKFLLDGHTSSEALNMASLSIRAFTEFSSMIHWSGYQITGKDVTVRVSTSNDERFLRSVFGRYCSAFPQLKILNSLKIELIDERLSDIQIVCGSADASLSEPIIDFCFRHYDHFPGGIFWMNAHQELLFCKQYQQISELLNSDVPILIVLDAQSSEVLEKVLKKFSNLSNASIIVALSCVSGKYHDSQVGARRRLISTYDTTALTELQVTQRLVYHIQHNHYLAPGSDEREALSYLSSLCLGSPILVEVMNRLIDKYIIKFDSPNDGLKRIYKHLLEVQNLKMRGDRYHQHHRLQDDLDDKELLDSLAVTDSMSSKVVKAILACHIEEEFISISSLVLFRCLSLFGSLPVPQTLIEIISRHIVDHCSNNHSTSKLSSKVWSELHTVSLLHRYPSLAISRDTSSTVRTVPLFYIPDVLAEGSIAAVSVLDDDIGDNVVCAALIHSAVEEFISERMGSSDVKFASDCIYLAALVNKVRSFVDNDDLWILENIAQFLCERDAID